MRPRRSRRNAEGVVSLTAERQHNVGEMLAASHAIDFRKRVDPPEVATFAAKPLLARSWPLRNRKNLFLDGQHRCKRQLRKHRRLGERVQG